MTKQMSRAIQPLNLGKGAGNAMKSNQDISAKLVGNAGPSIALIDRAYRNKSTAKSTLRFGIENILGNSEGLQKALNLAKAAAQNDASVLLQGESGTGKEMFAQSIHELSPMEGAFVAINCGSIPRSLVESELFGYEAGSFTGADRRGRIGKFELAHNGTLFLDEIADMPLSMQPVLLRAIEEKQIVRLGSDRCIALKFRVIAATNQNLKERVRDKRFREDLYYRLSAFKIFLPSLRERWEDIVFLAQHFADKACADMGKNKVNLSEKVQATLMFYNWPGNIRQLQNAMVYAVSLNHSGTIEYEDLPEEICNPDPADSYISNAGLPSMPELEREAIKTALNFTNYNVIEAAKILKISKSTLYR
ncbi:MAG TPA: sigma 54-interacting transcriptional regulator, partial [Syntrophomonas sp.]|nr:sigma 54-interacting transcriptional regulator [Syntrophomonas sp.]